MTTEQLDQEFVAIYPQLQSYATKALQHFRSPIDSSALLAECYLHLRRYENELTTPEQVISYAKNWIKQNVRWKKSPINKAYSLHEIRELSETLQDDTFSIEDWLKERTHEFKSSLNSYDQRLWSIYFEKHKVSGKLIAEHLDMSISTGYTVLRECKRLSDRYREFLLKYI